VARLSLVPQKREFFVLYSRAARNTVEIARLLVELLDEFPRGEGSFATSRIWSTRAIG
jgi:hypothetical protein